MNQEKLKEKEEERKLRDWYSVSTDTVRAWTIVCLLVASGVVGYFGWRHWQAEEVERQAYETLQEALTLREDVDRTRPQGQFEGELAAAEASLSQARDAFSAGAFSQSVSQGNRAVALFSSRLGALSDQGGGGEARFISLAGNVEFRRGEHGEWQEARRRVRLRDGYFIRTGDESSAEVLFVDGTLYTVRPKSQILVSRARAEGRGTTQQVRMEYGWINLNTADRENRVMTPEAQATIDDNSSAGVGYDRESESTSFAAYTGSVTVAAGDTVRTLEELEQVTQTRGRLSAPHALPGVPRLAEPLDNFEAAIAGRSRVSLSWRPVSGARNYHLQVSRSPLFVDNIIDAPNRSRLDATLDARGEGAFLWRVAAVNPDGSRGAWSQPRKFLVTSSDTGAADRDTEPPELSVDSPQHYGNIFIVRGFTEPGASVTVRGERVTVMADGAFTKTLQIYEQGWNFVEVRAEDVYGNRTVRPLRLYVDSL